MATNDRFGSANSGISGPGDDAFAVTPSDSTAFTIMARALYVGTTGDVTLITRGGTTLTFTAVPAGAIIPVRCSQVKTTGTTASNIVGFV